PIRAATARPVLPPPLELDVPSLDLRDPAATPIGLAGHVDASIRDLERLERAPVAEPVGDELAQKRSLQQAVQDDAGEPHAARELLVVVDLVEVALSARVL